VLAPNAKLRLLLVPRGHVPEEQDTEAVAECEAEHAQTRLHRII
jgi:hypothetical protein